MCTYCENLATNETTGFNEGESLLQFHIPFGLHCGFEYKIYMERGMNPWPNLVATAGTCDEFESDYSCRENTMFYESVPMRYCPSCGRELMSREDFIECQKAMGREPK